ncbi:MAG: hypothetical protein HZB16_23585 [Armatimonadetes bacterium]|nr:hypothetical protein [Armatimonadota bacterium]
MATPRMARLGALAGTVSLAALVAAFLSPAGAEDTIKLPLKLPRAAFAGTPKELPEGVENVEPVPTEAQFKAALPQVPASIAQVAIKKGVTSSAKAYSGSLELITDGQKEAYEDTAVELKPKTQWVQIDLGAAKTIYAIELWHFHLEPVIFHDIVVQISNDPTFQSGVTTVFNNDKDNSSGLGAGSNREYWETNLGKVIGGRQTSGRYVRCYSRGSTYTDSLNRYTEIEVWAL